MAIYTQHGSPITILAIKPTRSEVDYVEASVMYDNGNKGNYPIHLMIADGGKAEVARAVHRARTQTQEMKTIISNLMGEGKYIP